MSSLPQANIRRVDNLYIDQAQPQCHEMQPN